MDHFYTLSNNLQEKSHVCNGQSFTEKNATKKPRYSKLRPRDLEKFALWIYQHVAEVEKAYMQYGYLYGHSYVYD